MTIKPVNKVYIPTTLISASSSTSSEKPLATGMWGQDESPIEPESIVRVPFGGGLNVTWFGILGPEVWVGPMQICSRSDKNSEVVCTSSSTPTFHARVLPFNLSDSLLALPPKPISPILLLVTAICVFLSTIVHAFSLSNVGTCRYPNLSRSRLIPKHESEESIDIDVLPKRRSGPHPAFIVLVVVGSILSIAAAALERSSVRRALVGWDVDAGDEIGLVASMGVLAHLIPLIPFFLLLSLSSSYIPLFTPPHPNNIPIEAGAEVRGRSEISGLFAHVTDSGKKLSDGKPVFAEISPGTPRLSVMGLPEIVIVPSTSFPSRDLSDEKDVGDDEKSVGDERGVVGLVIEGPEDEGVPRSAASCRTFGVGEAV